MSENGHRVFVYGTLKPGGHYWPQFCEGRVSSVTPAKIKGTLYDLHLGYPGLRLEGDTFVQGFILTFESQFDFDRLDELEGYMPNRPESENEYNRLEVECISPDGVELGAAWIYEVTPAVLKRTEGTRISDGIWPI
ncbi:MAG: gamma-glutamylcyclotransferase [Coraliomargarita sp.]|nr:gamma-glutamylcyclotransferase [Coraliomargarita sp.]